MLRIVEIREPSDLDGRSLDAVIAETVRELDSS
jgi:hypothetical protein